MDDATDCGNDIEKIRGVRYVAGRINLEVKLTPSMGEPKRDSMKKLAYLLIIVGVLTAVIAFNLDVTVGDSGITNMNLMAQRQNLLIVGCVGFLAGIVLLVGTQHQKISSATLQTEAQGSQPLSKSAPVATRISSLIEASTELFERFVLRGNTVVHFLGKFVGGITSAIVGKTIFNKIFLSIIESDFFYGKLDLNIWLHTEIFYFPLMLFIFFIVMRRGFPVLLRIFLTETLICLLGAVFFALIFNTGIISMLEFFSFEIGICILGIVLIRFVGKRGVMEAR